MSDQAWWVEFEGPEASLQPAAHWVAAYRDLERTLTAIVLEKPEAASRLWDVRRRLHHWEAEARRWPEQTTGAAAR